MELPAFDDEGIIAFSDFADVVLVFALSLPVTGTVFGFVLAVVFVAAEKSDSWLPAIRRILAALLVTGDSANTQSVRRQRSAAGASLGLCDAGSSAGSVSAKLQVRCDIECITVKMPSTRCSWWACCEHSEAAFLHSSLKTHHLDWGLRHLADSVERRRRISFSARLFGFIGPGIVLFVGIHRADTSSMGLLRTVDYTDQ